MRTFKHIALLIKEARIKNKIGQRDLELKIYNTTANNGMIIGHIERAITSVPINRIKNYADALSISRQDIIYAMVLDYRETLNDGSK